MTEQMIPDKIRWTGNEWEGAAKGKTFSFLMHDITIDGMVFPRGWFYNNSFVVSPTYALNNTSSWKEVK